MPEAGLPDDRLVVELRQQPAHRPREAHARIVPAHRLREREAADDPVDLLGEDRAQLASRDRDAEEAVAHLELLHAYAVLLGEAGCRPVTEALGWSLDPLVLGSLGQILGKEADPSRPDEKLGGRNAEMRVPDSANT